MCGSSWSILWRWHGNREWQQLSCRYLLVVVGIYVVYTVSCWSVRWVSGADHVSVLWCLCCATRIFLRSRNDNAYWCNLSRGYIQCWWQRSRSVLSLSGWDIRRRSRLVDTRLLWALPNRQVQCWGSHVVRAMSVGYLRIIHWADDISMRWQLCSNAWVLLPGWSNYAVSSPVPCWPLHQHQRRFEVFAMPAWEHELVNDKYLMHLMSARTV